MHLHKSKDTKFKQLKYSNKHNRSNKHTINKHPNVNQYRSIYFADIKSQVQYILLIFVIYIIEIKYKVHIHKQINIVKENKTITESIKNNIQKDRIMPKKNSININCFFYVYYV